jgi:hypothetical protein
VVALTAGLFSGTYKRLVNQPTGFSAERILNVETVTQSPQSPVFWNAVADRLREVPGVEKVALIGWPLMSGESAVGNISVAGAPPGDVFSDFVSISPGLLDTMKIALLGGRDFRPGDVNPGVAIVNQAFAMQYFNGANPVGRSFERVEPAGGRARIEIVGLVGNARSRDRLRWPIRPTAYIPFPSAATARGTLVVRSISPNPMSLASTLRREVARARPGFRVTNVRTQIELNLSDGIRERLLATLAVFFAGLALLLAGVGLFGVLDYSVVQKRREIAIRRAIGAPAAHVISRVAADVIPMVFTGILAGWAIALLSVRYIQSLLYQVSVSDAPMLAIPALTILVAAGVATAPAVIRAARIDPAIMLRED